MANSTIGTARAIPELTAERLRELLDYDPVMGVFTRRIGRRGTSAAGSKVGTMGGNGYLQAVVDGEQHYAHRLAWLHVTGNWPAAQIDHIDGDKSNNAISNLRDVPQSVNQKNRRHAMSTNKSSGLLGVSANRGRWQATIRIDGKHRFLGRFDTPEKAHEAYLDAKRKYHAGCTI